MDLETTVQMSLQRKHSTDSNQSIHSSASSIQVPMNLSTEWKKQRNIYVAAKGLQRVKATLKQKEES